MQIPQKVYTKLRTKVDNFCNLYDISSQDKLDFRKDVVEEFKLRRAAGAALDGLAHEVIKDLAQPGLSTAFTAVKASRKPSPGTQTPAAVVAPGARSREEDGSDAKKPSAQSTGPTLPSPSTQTPAAAVAKKPAAKKPSAQSTDPTLPSPNAEFQPASLSVPTQAAKRRLAPVQATHQQRLAAFAASDEPTASAAENSHSAPPPTAAASGFKV